MITQYRGVEQLVARRAHNPKVMWFKSLLRNQIVRMWRISLTSAFLFLRTKQEQTKIHSCFCTLLCHF